MAKQPMSKIRKMYFSRLIGRVIALVLCVLLWLRSPAAFDILQGMNFFAGFSPLSRSDSGSAATPRCNALIAPISSARNTAGSSESNPSQTEFLRLLFVI